MMRISMRSIAALLLCVFLVACDSVEERAEEHYQNALTLIEQGDFQRAEVEFRNVFELNPLHVEARAVYAKMLLDQGELARANAQYVRVAEQLPNDVEARRVLTRLSLNNQNWEGIALHGAKLAELAPEDPMANIADVALRFREAAEDQDLPALEAAADEAEALLVDNPDVSILRLILIQRAMTDTDLDTALTQMDALIAQSPDQLELHVMRLQILGSLDRKPEIEESLIGLIDQFPEQEEFLPTLLQFYGSEGRAEDAIVYLRTYVAKNPTEKQATNTLIDLIVAAQGPEAAIEEVERLITVGENVTILNTQRGRLQFEAGDRDAGIATLEAIVSVEEEDETEETRTAKIVLARMLLGTGNEVGARRLVEEVLESDASNGAAVKMQASWLISEDKADEAVSLLRGAIDEAPDDWEAMLLMADAFIRNGSRELARDFVSLAVEASDHAPGPSLRFANILVDEDRLLLAEETLVKALRAQPNNLQLLTTLGRVQVAREDWPRVQQIEETLRRLGNDDATRVAAGLEVTRLASQSRGEEAMAILEGLNADGGNVQTIAALVRARLANGEGPAAIALAESSLEDDPDNLGLQMVLASAKLGVGDVEEGKQLIEKVLEQNDQVEGAWSTLIRIASAQNDPTERDEILERALTAMPNSATLAWIKASILTEAGDSEGAIAIYEEVYSRSSDSALIANNLATLLANTRDDEASIERAYTVARRLRGSNVPAFQDTYGWIAFRRGDAKEALPYLEDAAEALPDEPSVRYHLGMVYKALDRKEDALKEFLAAAGSQGNTAQFPEIALSQAEAEALEAEGISPTE